MITKNKITKNPKKQKQKQKQKEIKEQTNK